jgi:hypothetical protein
MGNYLAIIATLVLGAGVSQTLKGIHRRKLLFAACRF